jgi:hydrogenase expression/formation protein HypE
VGIEIDEPKLPVTEAVQAASELLGFDPLYLANEGKLAAIVTPDEAERVLLKMRRNKYGKRAQIIGEVTSKHPGRVIMKTSLGTSRIIDMLTGELLPRIC